MRTLSPEIIEKTKRVASGWQQRIQEVRAKEELKFHAMMAGMLKNPRNKVFLIELLDQSFRSGDPGRVADQLEYIFAKYENTDFFSDFEKLLIWLFRRVGCHIPNFSVPLFIRLLREEVSGVVIKGEEHPLFKHIQRRREEGTRVNINVIGEAVLGEKEAHKRLDKYVASLRRPQIDYISIKISTIFSQLNPLAHEWSVEELVERIGRVYDAAMANTFVDRHGQVCHKFVNLDMEEYRDLSLTVDAFMATLSKERFKHYHAGIVIQSYMPDAMSQLQKLAAWAVKRVEEGGAPIKVRLVKGANQEMERAEASLRGWPCITYNQKVETDANYKQLMDYLLDPAIAPCVHLGIASHNLFEHALATTLAKERKVESYLTAEMLEGMSEAAYRVLKEEGIEVILYAPTATMATFTNAVAYLVRRFDENTAEGNFMRHSFGLEAGSAVWHQLEAGFEEACRSMGSIPLEPFRTQDRGIEEAKTVPGPQSYRFENESDTDFILEPNRRWAEAIRDKWQNIGKNGGFHAEVVVGGESFAGGERTEVIDKSQYREGALVGSYAKASAQQLQRAADAARNDPDGWRKLSSTERGKILMEAANEVRRSRGDLIGVAAAEVGKVFTETDVEVSEAIDFLNFYPYSVAQLESLAGVNLSPKGAGLVVSPWNFPVAIPAGGITAALAAGNTVILKPASAAVLSAYRLCECFWAAGVGKNTLQFVPCDGALAGRELIPNRAIDFVIFTGGESTAYEMIRSRPDIHLSAETGGKDATIITAMADRDQALANVLASAFNNSGQKCSATSLLVLEREVYEDEAFKAILLDAASSLETGSVWAFENKIGSLVDRPAGKLAHALEHLDEGESWLLPPAYADNDNPYMLRPAIRWGTKRGDYCHTNELFGPLLSVICAEDLDDAIDIVNATGYGLTSGIESLDEREVKRWKEALIAGNLYINRPTTGAIVLRQPFGGMRKSAIGSGKKAGGPNYVTQFLNITAETEPQQSDHPLLDKLRKLMEGETHYKEELKKVLETVGNFVYWNEKEFTREHDHFHIRGESNILRYRGVKSVLLRFGSDDTLFEMLCSYCAAKIAGAKVTLSISEDDDSRALLWFAAKQKLLLEEEDDFVMENELALIFSFVHFERIRFLKPEHVSEQLYKDIADKAYYLATAPFVSHGRIELMHYYIEQSVSHRYHRYGNLGSRALEKKEIPS
ncbi:bifunctional proline dehydrogenase/L-glutamate gamma-semialdehyde dehydrogenase [Sulfurimonas sp. HSL3-7]|uniref:bifunctional proline dehydrogenase/L-glutamate gamma-semialdehyde dehydrogenase n=1 Tax=Sulfonitrofixus jiaomeiensis TaxID=3131938 RepID=UPI0031FA13B9